MAVVQDLNAEAVLVREYISSVGIFAFDGLASDDRSEVWAAGGWRDFLSLAVKVGVQIVYMHMSTYSGQDFLERLLEDETISMGLAHADQATQADGANGDGAGHNELDATRREVRLSELLNEVAPGLAEMDGRAQTLFLAWTHSGVWHRIWLGSPISELVDDAEEKLQEHFRQPSADARSKRLKARESRDELLANALAAHPRWPDATNPEKRAFVARKMFPDLPRHELQSIIALAQTVMWWNSAQTGEDRNLERVREQLVLGRSKYAIAALLGLSEAQVGELVAVCKASEARTGGNT